MEFTAIDQIVASVFSTGITSTGITIEAKGLLLGIPLLERSNSINLEAQLIQTISAIRLKLSYGIWGENPSPQVIADKFNTIIGEFKDIQINDRTYLPKSIHVKYPEEPFLFIMGDPRDPIG